MKILVTGFTPFGGETMNPAYEAVKLLPDVIAGAEIVKAEVPTAFGSAKTVLQELLARHTPDAVLCVGQAGGRANLTVEKVAINYADVMPDYDEQSGIMENVIEPQGETAYFTTLPIRAMLKAMREAGVPAGASYTAGTFVCNYLMYEALFLAKQSEKSFRAGFIHVPFAPRQAIGKGPSIPSMALETMTLGLTAAIRAVAENENDLPATAMRMGRPH